MKRITFNIRGKEYHAVATSEDLIFFSAMLQMTDEEWEKFQKKLITTSEVATERMKQQFTDALKRFNDDAEKAFGYVYDSWKDGFGRYVEANTGKQMAYRLKGMMPSIPEDLIQITPINHEFFVHRFNMDFEEVIQDILLPIFKLLLEVDEASLEAAKAQAEPAPAPVEVHQAIPAQAQPKREKPTGFTQKSEELASLPVPPRKPAPVAAAEPDQVDAILAKIRAMPQTEQRGAYDELPKEQQEALFAKLTQAT